MTRSARKKTVRKSERIRIVRACARALRGFMTTDIFERAFAHEINNGGRYDPSYREYCRKLAKEMGDGLAVVEKRIIRGIRGRR